MLSYFGTLFVNNLLSKSFLKIIKMRSFNNFAYFLFGVGIMLLVYVIIFFQFVKQAVAKQFD